ncbi:MAG: hydantoinase/oxoprolinase family protein [Burkholderiaceae bacterium]
MSASITLGVDVGGTFTDIFALDEAAGRVHITKVPSTRPDPSAGFLAGIDQAVEMHQKQLADVLTIVHGTTVGTNALLERKVARCGLITTRGFRDVLEMRRRDRPTTWGLDGQFVPLIDRRLRLEVDERTLADGTVAQAVSQDQVKAAAQALLEAGCEAVCLFFINSYANAANEKAALAALEGVWPNPHLTASHNILPEVREFERASTASLNAALQPVVGRYVATLETALEDRGASPSLLIVQSNGGLMSVGDTHEYPVRTALSGPAAGVIACAHVGDAAGFPDLITGDVGGTSFDVSLIANGQIAQASQQSIDFGMVVRTPMVEIRTIGAGGGSIASVDESGLLQVGPESAGSDPGPVCYGLRPANDSLGPTVTDANLVLGRINPERPIGKLSELKLAATHESIDRHIGKPLGLPTEQAAQAILAVANANMAGAIRLISIERGHDPARFAYMPFGGGGALHVCAMMREVGIQSGLIPRFPGVSSALGCAIADMRHDFVQTLNTPLDRLDAGALIELIETLTARGRLALADAGVNFTGEQTHLELDMLYQGQTHTVAVPVTEAVAAAGGSVALPAAIRSAFVAAYEQAFGTALSGVPIRVLNLRVTVTGKRPRFDLSVLAPDTSTEQPDKTDAWIQSRRPCHHEEQWFDTPVYDRLGLPVNSSVFGPALFEQSDTTIWLEPGFSATVDSLGNLVIKRTDQEA